MPSITSDLGLADDEFWKLDCGPIRVESCVSSTMRELYVSSEAFIV